jgi:TPR repeat protein
LECNCYQYQVGHRCLQVAEQAASGGGGSGGGGAADEEATSWFRKAAAQGHARAQVGPPLFLNHATNPTY